MSTSFSGPFSTSTPAGSALANTLDTVLQGDKTALKERLNIEHFDVTKSGTREDAAAPGRLRAGLAGVILECTEAERNAIRDTLSTPATIVDGGTAWGPGKGAVVRDSTSGILYIWDAALSDWKQLDGAYRTPTGSSSHLTNTYLNDGGYFPLALSNISQDKLNALFGTSNAVMFSATRNTAVHFLGVIKNGVDTSWLIAPAISATAGGVRAHIGGCVCQLTQGITNATFNTGACSVIVPAGMYFKYSVFWKVDFASWSWAGERATITVAEVNAAFGTFNVCAFYL